MAGSISLSMSQQFKLSGSLCIPLSGGKLYTLAAGETNTPQNAYQDYGLTILHPNPIILDEAGRVPPFYLDDGFIKIRLVDADGLTQIEQDNLLVVGPSSGEGGGGGGGVDATTVLTTGDVKYRYGSGALSGFVRANGRSIGSSTSGATERANADCEALFNYLWQTDSNLTVSTGRGASSAADWSANKNILLPDARGRVLAGLDGMGNSAAGRLTSSYFGSDATVLGAANGGESFTLLTANLPPYTPSGSITVSQPTWQGPTNRSTLAVISNGVPSSVYWSGQTATSLDSSITATLTGTAQGGLSTPLRTVQPTLLVTTYIKL